MPPRSIDEYLGKGRDTKLEDIETLSEVEWLGLDKPKYELLRRGQSQLVPRIAYLLGSLGSSKREILVKKIFEQFNLNTDPYDETHNPRGAFLPRSTIKTKRPSADTGLALHLVGTNTSLISGFFGTGRGGGNLTYSPAAESAVAEARNKRQTFAFAHPDTFPQVHRAFMRLAAYGISSWADVYTPGHLPLPRELSNVPKRSGIGLSLEQSLQIIGDALSSLYTIKEIALQNKLDPPTVHHHFFTTKILTDSARALIQEKIKKG